MKEFFYSIIDERNGTYLDGYIFAVDKDSAEESVMENYPYATNVHVEEQ